MTYRIGVDLGGTKVSVAVLNSRNETVFSDRLPTPASEYGEVIDTVDALVQKALAFIDSVEINKIGIGIPGAMHQNAHTVKNANMQCLIGKPLKVDLEKRLNREFVIANDATCFTASEAADGAAKNERVVFGVILGTGAGGGIAFEGKPWAGLNSLAGEWGHNPFPFYGAPAKNRSCYCGKIDCNEQVISGPALAADYEIAAGKKISTKDLERAAKNGDEAAVTVLDEFHENLAKALSTIINLLDPSAIVVGGGVSNISSIYQEVPLRWGRYVFNASPDPAVIATKLLRNRWGDDSGVRGAAWLT
ncbi:ROK family protein [Hyphococcus flavus]|uniref:ROK family protein n=1 Tax=Hyphococcus flavus TaxID=1866326 RepID=A0AAF0CFM4_9PROT|nr:ROK family protein [Hyphococcus flavus]WDI31138.1 ROK family protein [Hyphococcus flavus]